MKITNVDSFIEEFRNCRNIWSKASIELVVREIERLRKENHKLATRLAALDSDLVLFEVSEMLKKTQARVQELEDANFKLRDELNAIETVTDARFEYKNGELSTHEMVSDTFARLDQAHAELAELRESNRWIPVSERLPEWSERVLIRMSNYYTVIASYFSIPNYWKNDSGATVLNVTHWMPLPPMPAEEE